jgi:hypothetical protein
MDEKAPDHDPVNHPSHYNWHPVCECIDISEHFPKNLGSAIEYIWRAGRKVNVDTVEDLRKATWYLERQIYLLTREGKAR